MRDGTSLNMVKKELNESFEKSTSDNGSLSENPCL